MEIEWLKKNGWVIFGIILIPINLVCLIGSIFTRNPFEALWISHYSGLIGAIVLIYQFKKPFLNGIYSYLFILQLGSVITHSIDLCINPIYVNYLDIFYWLNHLPHFVGFYLLAKKEFNINGVHVGFIFLLLLTNLSFQIIYLNLQAGIITVNIVYRDYFLFVLLLLLGWYIILNIFYYKKKNRII